MARPVVSDRRTRLWAAIESGYDRLDPAAQSLFAQLAVFRDGWNLSAMTSVCRLESGATLPVLDRLVDHSFVTVTQAEEGPTRYRLLEVLRQFALARLDESGRHDATLRRFVDHMVSVAESAAASLSGPEGPGSFATLDAELDNLRSIFPVEAIWAAEPKRRLAVAMIPYWHSRGLFNEGRALLREAVAAMDAPTTATVTALSGLSWLSWAQGELGIAARCARAAFRAARRSGDRRAGAHALLRLAQARFDMGRPASAGRATRRASEIATELADDRLGAECILQLGQVALVEGRLEEAGGLLRDGVQRIARTGLADRRAMAVLVLGRLHLERGDLAEAESVLRQSLTEVRQLAMVRHSVPILETLAAVAEERGEHLRAARLAGAAEGLLEGMHARPPGTAPMRLLIVPRLTRARNAKDGEVAFAEGRRMDLPAAIAFALGESEPPAPPPPTRREPGRDVLTPRQLVVARSIAEGRTNKEIAARLGRSERTVEGHVEQILNKLTLNKRTQIATWVARGAAGQGRASPAP